MAHQHQRPIDKEFEDAEDTGVLVLSGRNLRTFPVLASGELLDYGEVFEADFSKNRLDRLPKEVVSFKSLVKLSCHHNSIRYIPEELSTLTELVTVDFSRNYIQTVPPEVCHMKLKSLNLSNNRLVSLPLEFGKLIELQYLNLSCNYLQELPPSFSELATVQYCDLSRNELKDLPEDLYQLHELHFLDVSANQITRLPPTLRLLSSIQNLRVMDNPLESPPTQLCLRGLVHIFKYLESVDKRGSNSSLLSSGQRDESLRRRRGKKSSLQARPVSESTPIKNGGQNHIGLFDEMASLVHKTFGDGESTPTGSLHWSVQQFMNEDKTSSPLTDQSKEDYREAAQRLYLQQERQKSKLRTQRSSSPPVGSSTPKEDGSSNFNTLPKRKSEENMAVTGEGVKVGSGGGGRSLPNERQPRSGSWNSHMRKANAVLPSKYNATPPAERSKSANISDEDKAMRNSPVSRSAPRPQSDYSPSEVAATASPKRAKKKPAPLDVSAAQQYPPAQSDRGDSDREGSITPTNEDAPTLDDEEPTTPKEKKLSQSLDNVAGSVEKTHMEPPQKKVAFSSAENLQSGEKTAITDEPTNSSTEEKVPGITIEELEGSPKSKRRPPPSIPSPEELSAPTTPPDSDWRKNTSPRRRKEKDVFKFLKESDSNYIIRRQ